ncbi:helicase-associated domain-containing protein, partial [Paenibacillus zanthoxyli]|uniref:helicase-associated domain-containing protein n=1 Tax=Paenibacillus zanthoxyli TaxID=369399 RepID=UPI0018DE0267
MNDQETSGGNSGLQRLSGDACSVLKRIAAAHADHPFQEGKEDSLRPSEMTRAEFRLALSELWREGWLVAVRKIGGERIFYIPSGRWEAAQNHFFPITPPALSSDGIHLSAQAGPGLAGELFRSLLFAAEEGLPLTTKGTVHKKYVNLLAAKLQLNERHLQGLGLRSPYPEDYPLPAILAMDLLLHLGLLERGQQAYSLAAPSVENWLRLDDSEMFTLLLNAVSRRYGRRTSADRHFRCLIARPAYIPRRWYSLKDTIGWMEAQGLSVPGDRAAFMEASVAWLNSLAGLGWCEAGVTGGGSPCFRWTSVKPTAEQLMRKAGQAAERIIVQPDLEVLVPEETTYSLRWSLACFAELDQCDGMWSFRLTRERLERASGRGMSPQEIIAWLDRCAKNGLPGEVRAVLGQWSRDIGRTALVETLVLSCRNEQDADLIAGHP